MIKCTERFKLLMRLQFGCITTNFWLLRSMRCFIKSMWRIRYQLSVRNHWYDEFYFFNVLYRSSTKLNLNESITQSMERDQHDNNISASVFTTLRRGSIRIGEKEGCVSPQKNWNGQLFWLPVNVRSLAQTRVCSTGRFLHESYII